MRESKGNKPTFAIVGLGYVFQKHQVAIDAIGGEIVAGCDTDRAKSHKLSSGRFFADYERMLKGYKADYVVVCTPNYLHVPMVEMALRLTDAQIICEKPVGITAKSLKKIDDDRVNCMLQLRQYSLPETKKKNNSCHMDININRGAWYFQGWKGHEKMSGGLLFNIGVHYFDIVNRLMGEQEIEQYHTVHHEGLRSEGNIKFASGTVDWKISLCASKDNQYRIIKINDDVINLTSGIDTLHTNAYRKILDGKGVKVKEVVSVTNLIEKLNK